MIKASRKHSKLSDPPIVDVIQDKYYPQSIIEIFNHDVIDVDKKFRETPLLRRALAEKVEEITALS